MGETVEMAKLNRNCETLPNANTDDYISNENHALIKKLAESGPESYAMVDMLFQPLCNFHPTQYKSIANRWG